MSETLSPPRSGPAGFRAAWAVPLIPVAVSGFLLSAMTWFRLSGASSTGAESGLQGLVVGLYEAFGFEPLFMVCVLALTWSSIWFLTGEMERPLGRLARIVALGVCLAILVNLRVDGSGAGDSGALGAFLASRMSATLTPTLSILLVAAASVAALLLATDFFFYGHFDGLARRSRERQDRRAGAVEQEAVAALEELRLEVPEVAPRPAEGRQETTSRADSAEGSEAPPMSAAIAVEEPDADAVGADRVAEPEDDPDPWARDTDDDVPDPAGAFDDVDSDEIYGEHGPFDDEDAELDADDDDSRERDALPEDEEDDPAAWTADDAALEADDEDADEPEDFAEPPDEPPDASPEDDELTDDAVLAADDEDADEPEDSAEPPDEHPGASLEDDELADDELADDELPDDELPGDRLPDDDERAEDAEPSEAPRDEPLYALERPDPAQGRLFDGSLDPELVAEAEALVLEYRRASANFLKRRLRVSMDDALALLQALAQRGVVECEAGSAQGRVVAGP